MFGTLAIIVAVQATAVLSGARYPSGLNPALCPNYPHCDNALLAAYAQPAAGAVAASAGGYDNGQYHDHYDNGQYHDHYNNEDGHYNSGYQRHHSFGAAGLYKPVVQLPYTEPGYPAGLSSSNCPNYPYCSHQVPAEALNYETKRYPAGITPQNCPNYPYCY